jgi:hypothetical protein
MALELRDCICRSTLSVEIENLVVIDTQYRE